MNLEVCAMNIQSAQAAEKAGADRIELCVALPLGGLTPSPGLIREAVNILKIPVHVLIRPREGDFCYSATELRLMVHDVRFCREVGAAGVVVGAAKPDHTLDRQALQAMKEAAGGLHLTCHRVFDFTPDPLEALDTLVEMQFTRVLSSGQAATAWEGRDLLRQMTEHAGGSIEIMAGAGIHAGNVGGIIRATGVNDLHFSGKKAYKRPDSADIPGLEAEFWLSDEATLREIVLAARG